MSSVHHIVIDIRLEISNIGDMQRRWTSNGLDPIAPLPHLRYVPDKFQRIHLIGKGLYRTVYSRYRVEVLIFKGFLQ